ncbi:SPOR domain-containing protein [Xanthomonas euvesicatoria pv. euvesicatoria]|uniref:Sporulation protein n=4 Tax=Xanthomonas euvesicatoria TaxID=456327 RepID=A0A6B3KBU6_XANEU|nr:SPOR domain-containing protein [Xanthomonas euvesicatoria]MBO9855361.1 SPOR domain-containing protein [Xanthomonas sp. A1809]MBV6671072.1 SPOR domain-containing protein [Xanthomonas euvesicatoria pv. alangii]MBV6793137.1 SPOR domain-containing protein [Xanthomonas campestris pv. daturae]MBV6804693.1 SPOR domain-containing protein [Xanthomonas campestris pv. convolvuli]MBV6887507.1 SPOR domain-containing protein [Xanthomonas campestris pv. spermacoces]MCP3046930.1 SPOR domain-containing pro
MDTALKQRLIGAIVLVALAVIFLPMLVKGPAPSSGVADVPLEAPAAPANGEFETRELPLVTPGNAPAGGALGMAGAPAPVQNNPDAADLAAPSSTPSAPEVAAGNYAVNFGAYATSADADAVIARLKQAQLPGFSEKTQINGRPAWRVRVGPYADQAQAESARLQAVKVRSDVNAQVVTLDANAAAPAPVASAPAPAPAVKPGSSVAAASTTAPTKTESLPPEPAKPVVAAPKPAEVAKPVPAKPEVTKPAPAKPELAAKPEPAKPVATAPAAPAASAVGFAVQLGAFGRAEDADALRDRVRAAGFSAFVEQVRTDKGALNRVRVGPVANRSDAEQLRAQVAAKVGISGMVRPHP